ncbi:hypothetical protein AKJ51_03450 [candidate division MSBL1 archaeon SCGC-AAA382A20]|uniref:Uncharacterized protein n=1 Tax=candidate division MSBL1 archaeon SCGC-AAA382A20 TaxID=1698280 RepID=A0A133VJF9_9EURY|nr:hypothetical protein AKJ51_03450 [candidate division MSBL1 archaeon SCGC-AAA382A20]
MSKRKEVNSNGKVYRFSTRKELHPRSIWEIEFKEGMWIVFGEPKTKWKSGDFRLKCVEFKTSKFSPEKAEFWWSNFRFIFLPEERLNKSIQEPEGFCKVDSAEGYVFILKRGAKKKPAKKWIEE